jgi:hypothetical protein
MLEHGGRDETGTRRIHMAIPHLRLLLDEKAVASRYVPLQGTSQPSASIVTWSPLAVGSSGSFPCRQTARVGPPPLKAVDESGMHRHCCNVKFQCRA